MIKALEHRARPRSTLIVAAIALVPALALRIVDLTGTSLQIDEAYSVWVVQSLDRYVARLPTDGHPPLWYLLLAAWTAVAGSSDFSARLLSALAAIPLVALTALLARRMFDASTARWAAVLSAGWPLLVSEERIARMYAWLPVATALAALLLVRALERPSASRWAVAGAGLALLTGVHYTGAALAGGLLLGAAMMRRDRWRGVAITGAVWFALAAPMALPLLGLIAVWGPGGSHGIGPGSLLQLATSLTVGIVDLNVVVLLAASALVLQAMAVGLRRSGPWAPFLLSALLIGLVIPASLAELFFAFALAPQYFIALVPILIVLVARAAATARLPAGRAHRFALTALLWAASGAAILSQHSHHADWRGLARLVEGATTEQREIHVAPVYFRLAFERYYRGPLPVRGVPEVGPAPSEFPRPSDDEMVALASTTVPSWLLIPDYFLASDHVGEAVREHGREVPTGWVMRAFVLGVSP